MRKARDPLKPFNTNNDETDRMRKKSGLRQFLDAKKRLLEHRAFDSIRHRLHAETLWHLNRRSLAGGLAAGLFAAFIPFPMQMLIAAVLAILWQANMPVALVSTWISNPLTYAPIFYINYKLGVSILQLFHPVTEQTLQDDQSWLVSIQEVGAPLLVGSIGAATLAASIGYVFARGVWRFITIRKLKKRQRERLTSRALD